METNCRSAAVRRAGAVGALLIGLAWTTAPAWATDYVGTPAPTVGPTDTAPPAVLGQELTRTAPGQTFPVTGADVAGLTALGAGAAAVGVVLVRRGRARLSQG